MLADAAVGRANNENLLLPLPSELVGENEQTNPLTFSCSSFGYDAVINTNTERLGSSSRADGFSLVAGGDEEDEQQLFGGGGSGGGGGGRHHARGRSGDSINAVGSGRGVGGNDPRQHLSSDKRTFVNLLISFVGAGVLGIPYAYRQVIH